MSIYRLTNAQMRQHVIDYHSQPYGKKTAYLECEGLTRSTISRWGAQLAAGTLETGLVPRTVSGLGNGYENKELIRMADDAQKHQQQMSQLKADHAEELAKKDARIAQAESAADALGKAIALLQRHDERNYGTGPDSPKTNEP
jgi:hypothetical protein